MSTSRPGPLVAGLVVAGLLLSGCGSARPGVAAQVGDERITVREVDQLAQDYCQAFEEQFEGNGEVVPHRYLRGGILGLITRRTIAEQLAEQYAVEPGDVYDDKVSQVEQSVQALPDEVHEAIITVETASAYVEAIQAAVGERLLDEEGVTSAKYTEQVARGERAFADFVAEEGVEVDPQYGIAVVDGQVTRVDTSLSYALSDDALKGGAEQPDPAYADSLPDAHRCG